MIFINENLTAIVQLPRLKIIGKYAFYECSNLQSVEFYESYSTTMTNLYAVEWRCQSKDAQD